MNESAIQIDHTIVKFRFIENIIQVLTCQVHHLRHDGSCPRLNPDMGKPPPP